MDRYEGFREFVVARGAALSRVAYLLTGDHQLAEDLVQTALERTAARWPRIRSAGNPEAYIRRIMVNERTTWWRRRRYVEQPSATPPDRSVGDTSDATVGRLAFAAALARLGPRQRAVLVLRYYEDLSEAETARLLGVTVGTVKRLAHDALARLRRDVPSLTEEAAR